MASSLINDFLRFSAYSIKDLITRKLSEDSNFTDLIYEGSNLAILIDIVSYMYLCLIYNINNAASESMFSDTLLYENISRLCKFIGYHPVGYHPALIVAYINNRSVIKEDGMTMDYLIYPCTAFDTGLYDDDGNKIYFSTVFDYLNNFKPVRLTTDAYTNIMLMNGVWKKYSTVFVANGIDYETFILDGILSDSRQHKYIANGKIQVFVESGEGDDSIVQRWDNDPNEIFILAYDSESFSPVTRSGTAFGKLYNEDSRVYTAYLNENKTYEIKFGNNILGKRLNPGDRVHVLYMQTNGPAGYIDLSLLQLTLRTRLFHSASFFGMSDSLYLKIFGTSILNDNVADTAIVSEPYEISLDPNSLTKTSSEENVESIRSNAPTWFKTGNRLITKKDYEYFVTSNRNEMFNGVVDAKCMNNWDYLTTFYRWLYNLGINPCEYAPLQDENPYKYLSKSRLIQAGYEYVDAADANNIYLWIATSNLTDIMTLKDLLNNSIALIKTMTSETYPLMPIDVYFDISFTPTLLYYDNLVNSNGECTFDKNWSYLEVTVSDNSVYSTTLILNSIVKIIEDAFSPMRCKIGLIISYDDILDKIYEINGIERVRTVYYPDNYLEDAATYSIYKTRACDGIAFASWSHTDLIDVGDDLLITNTTRVLEQFLFPKLVPGSLIKDKIKIIKKSMNTTSPIKF